MRTWRIPNRGKGWRDDVMGMEGGGLMNKNAREINQARKTLKSCRGGAKGWTLGRAPPLR